MARTKRMQNKCKDCGYTWYPKGKDLSLKCPSCGSRKVTYAGGGCAVIVVGIIVIWGLFRFFGTSDSPTHGTPSLSSPVPVVQPIPSASSLRDVPAVQPISSPLPMASAMPSQPSPTPLSLVEAAQREAVQRYPQLGVAGSDLNREFINRYNIHKHADPDYFSDSSWPLKLAEESFKAIAPK